MSKLENLTSLPVRIYQEAISDKERAFAPFAWTETFIRQINEETNQMIVHIWPMERTVILGMADKRLPHIQGALHTIEQQNYRPIIRNIGGLAVVADKGVLNFSLIIPDQLEERITIDEAYQMMVRLVRVMFSDFSKKIDCYEIEQSYCPGRYDLSIDGKKFAGIAQRRIKKGIVVSIYMSVNGDQMKRGQMIAAFYREGLQEEQAGTRYPVVDPMCMANLSELLDSTLTVSIVVERLKRALKQIGFDYQDWQPQAQYVTSFSQFYQRMNQSIRKE
ncbi:lipoate--protein ligase family protein [Atopobacter phocae]|uniref:lipoate--protein ligase family protein n=1 Tax=Atopobacter phocae TaxID=136492 RepID=UPI0004719602|nr:lipoate--protein ligase family protein [Atopobacter phocae]